MPDRGPPGTPRLFEDQRSYHPDGGKFHCTSTAYRLSAEPPDAEYPILPDLGAQRVPLPPAPRPVVHQKFLVDKAPGPLCEMHLQFAAQLSGRPAVGHCGDAPWRADRAVWWSSRRSGPTRCSCPYHWPEALVANQLTVRALDPVSKMPEFKVAAAGCAPRPDDEAAGAHPLR